MSDDPLPPRATIALPPLPSFLRRQQDQEPATVPSDAPSRPQPSPDSPPEESNPRPAGASRTAPPLPNLEPPDAARTATSATKKPASLADEKQAARVVGGLLVIGLASFGLWMARHGRNLRQPTEKQKDDISTPLGRIVARYLPADLLNGTLVDVTEAAAATHAYALDGDLIVRSAANPFEEINS